MKILHDAAHTWRDVLGQPIETLLVRKLVIAAYLLSVASACLWVPWTLQFHGFGDDGKHFVVQLPGVTYAPLWWSPPKTKEDKGGNTVSWRTARIDVARVALELLAMTAALGVFLVLSKRAGPSKP